jgi:D-xylose 1-dehydrogenase
VPQQSRSGAAVYPSLADKVVVITGGATGIGRAIAEAFTRQEARVSVLDKDADAVEVMPQEMGAEVCDVTDTAALHGAIEDVVRSFGRLDVLVTNAANDDRHDPEMVTPELWEAALAVNLGHQFFAAQAAEPHLRRGGGGSIICLGSIAWLNNTTEMVAYATAKSGVHGLVRTLARLWGHAGIRVNALVPGWTMTERQRDSWVDEEAERQIDAGQCLPGRVMPEDVAAAALFLASDEAAMITRQSLVVDAGWT